MPLVSAKCPSCGGNLKVNSEKDAAICKYCGNAYIVQDAINNYNTNVSINADVVNIVGAGDFEIKGGVLVSYNGQSVNVTIPEGVKEIGCNSFKNLRIESVVCPFSLRVIGEESFSNCCDLKTISFNDGLREIKAFAFYECTSLEKSKIPNSVKKIGEEAFRGCTNLKTLQIENRDIELETDVFSDLTKLTDFTYANSFVSTRHTQATNYSKLNDDAVFKFISNNFSDTTPLYRTFVEPLVNKQITERKKKEELKKKSKMQKEKRLLSARAILFAIVHFVALLFSIYLLVNYKMKFNSFSFGLITLFLSIFTVVLYSQLLDSFNNYEYYGCKSCGILKITDTVFVILEIMVAVFLGRNFSLIIYLICHIFPLFVRIMILFGKN